MSTEYQLSSIPTIYTFCAIPYYITLSLLTWHKHLLKLNRNSTLIFSWKQWKENIKAIIGNERTTAEVKTLTCHNYDFGVRLSHSKLTEC